MRRNTFQNSLILESVLSMSSHPTADEIYDDVVKKCPAISKGTVYSNLNKLVEDGLIRRVEVGHAPDRFDRITSAHSHFKCISCGSVSDYKISWEIEPDEGLNPDLTVIGHELIFKGYCGKCGNKPQNG